MQANSMTIDSTTDDVLRALRERRSIGKCTDETPDPSLIRELLESATWAPNHRLTHPWRFVVLSGDARNGLGEAMGAAAAAGAADPDAGERARAKAEGKPLRAPYVIAVYADPNPAEPEVEEIAATAAAVQNMLLAAHSLGLAAMWRSGDLIYSREVRNYLRMPEQAVMLGVVYVGYPAMDPPARTRRPVEDFAEWWDAAPES